MSFHIEYPRTIAAQRPGDFTPGAPKFQVRWQAPVTTVVSDYIAVQHNSADLGTERAFFDKARAAFASPWGPDCFDEQRCTDDAGYINSIVIAYWTDITRYAMWKHRDSFNRWFASAAREKEGVGYWRETLTVPYDRIETIFSEPYYRAGIARSQGCALEAMYVAGYFGAMRDRLPIAAVDRLQSPYGKDMPQPGLVASSGRRIRIDVPLNVVNIRSGQYWEKAEGPQLDDYYANLQPKLDTGMRYLKDHAETTGCLSLRSLVTLDRDGNELKETSKHGYFLCLGQLEQWAVGHKSHLDIFKHALAMRRQYGAARSVVTWHEVFVLSSTPAFEYVNCHPATGLLRFADAWGQNVSPTLPLPE